MLILLALSTFLLLCSASCYFIWFEHIFIKEPTLCEQHVSETYEDLTITSHKLLILGMQENFRALNISLFCNTCGYTSLIYLNQETCIIITNRPIDRWCLFNKAVYWTGICTTSQLDVGSWGKKVWSEPGGGSCRIQDYGKKKRSTTARR